MRRLTDLLRRTVRWDRSDSFLLEAVLGLAALLLLGFMVASVTDALGATCGLTGPATSTECAGPGMQATLKPDAPGFSGVVTLAEGTRLQPDQVLVILESPTDGQRMALLASNLFGGTVLLTFLALLYRVVRGVRRERGFAAHHSRTLLWAAAVLAGGGMAAELAAGIVRIDLLSRPELRDSVEASATGSWLPLLGGLFVAFLAEVFRRGAALQAELADVV